MKCNKKLVSIFSFFLGFAVFLSCKMPVHFVTVKWMTFSKSDILPFLLNLVLSLLFVTVANQLLDKIEIKGKSKDVSAKLIFLTILFPWLFVFLCFYPGNLSPDSYSSITQALYGMKSTANPVLFTLFVKLALFIGESLFHSVNEGVAVYSVMQMLVLTGILTYTVKWLERKEAPRWVCLLSTIYFAFHPLIVRYSFTMWKDILFSGVLLLLVLLLYDIGVGQRTLDDNKVLVRLVILSVLATFLRNRIIYAVAIIYLLLTVLYRKLWKKLFSVFLLSVVLTCVVQGPVYNSLNIKPSNFAEGQGVSLQQIAAVIVSGGNISAEEAEFVNHIIPLEDIPKAYFESTVDNLKGYETFDHAFLNNHSGEYIKVWWNILLKNPWICTKAWLMTSRGFWGFNVWVEPFAITWTSDELQIKQTNFIQQWTGIDFAYISNSVLLRIGQLPIVRLLFELGSLGWFSAFCMLRFVLERKYGALLAVMPLVALWLVLIFSTPIFFEARYIFAHTLSIPILLFLLLKKDKV